MSSICSICLDDNSYKELYTTNCNHIFHLECLLKIDYEKNKNINFHILNCPMCRHKISIPKIIKKTFPCDILSSSFFMNIKTINQKIRELHLNKNYIFIAGGFASAFYSSLTNKNKTIEYDNINLYYIDFDNLYEYSKHSKPIMKCENTNNIIKKIETYSNIDSYNRMLYEIAFLTSKTKNSIDMDILHSIQLLFNSYDLSCCKIAFVIKNNYLEFYIHTDYYLNIVNVCGHSMFHTGLRIDKYKKRGYQIDKYTTCCSCSYDFNREQDNNYIYYDNLEYDE